MSPKLEVLSRFLAPRERTVLCLLFGYPSGAPLTFTEVADKFGITPDMVKRIQAAALAKLRGRIVLAMLSGLYGAGSLPQECITNLL